MTDDTTLLDRGQGTLAVDVTGHGPLILAIPGMGELRDSFRHLTPGLVAAGCRLATMDLRGHGDSSLGFDSYDDEAAASDALAVIDALGGAPATIIGNSMGAGAAVIAAARAPDAVDRIVLIGPFVRDSGSVLSRLLLRLALVRPWGPAIWQRYYTSLFATDGPSDQADHADAVQRSLRRPGRWTAFQRTARTSHAAAEAALPHVRAGALVIMGERDPDFPDPAAEATWVANALQAQRVMVADAGHYPMAEQPAEVLAAILPFLSQPSQRG